MTHPAPAEQMYLISETQIKKLKWNYGSASPAMTVIEPEIRSTRANPHTAPTALPEPDVH